ncbi:MAG: TRAP transporter large permease, partial [Blautia hansenii]
MNTAIISGLIILVLLVIMLVAGVPIAVALGISSVCAILPVMDTSVAVLTGAQRIFSGISVFSLLAIPFFILAGNIMNKGGIAVRLINLAKLVTGRTPGALAQTNVLANMLFGAISGSGTAAASAMGSIIGPIEKDEGYDPNFSTAANIATAPTGLLIPPSNVMITFSLVSGGTSVAALFMAGYIPGILWGLACMIVIYFIAKKRNYRSKQKFTFKEAMNIIFQALPCLLLIIIVIGGIIAGVFTATEGSVVAVVYSLLLSLFGYKSIKLKDIPALLKDSAEMTGIIIFLIGVSSIMSWVMAFTNIPTLVSNGLLAISDSKIVILLMINIILLIVGTFMDMTPACLIFTPIFLPVCTALGMNTIHFGIMLIFNLCIGTITPPVGTTLFVGVKVGNVKIETVFKQLLVY